MRRISQPLKNRSSQAGFTIVELLIAGGVLLVGLLAVTGLFALAIGNNGRSKVDSTATMLTQSVMEQIDAVVAGGGPPSVTDCAQPPNTFTISTAAGVGAPLNGSNIDFTAAPVPGYSMNFTVCSASMQNTTAVYDVRWNVTQLQDATETTSTYLVTVAARPQNMVPGRFTFALPVTLRAYVKK